MIIPVNCQFEITERCNHLCPYCYNDFRENPNTDDEKFDSERIAQRICENELFSVVITGGEPFLVKEKLFRVAEIFHRENVDFSLNTNLTLAKREDLQRLKNMGLVSILTSIASSNSEVHDKITTKKGSFSRLLRGMETVADVGVPLAANMVINRMNQGQVYDLGKFLFERFGKISFCATPLIPSPGKCVEDLAIDAQEYVRGLDDLLRLKQEFGIKIDSLCPPLPCLFEESERYKDFLKRSCVGGRTTFTVSSDGAIRPCSHSKEKYGNILETRVSEVLSHMIYWRDSSLIPEDCAPCDYEGTCRGGCRVAALAFSGSLKGNHPYLGNPKITFKKPACEVIEPALAGMNFEIPEGLFRYRDEEDGSKTVYLNPHSFANLSDSEFSLFRILRSRHIGDLDRVRQELGVDFPFFDLTIGKFSRRGILHFRNKT